MKHVMRRCGINQNIPRQKKETVTNYKEDNQRKWRIKEVDRKKKKECVGKRETPGERWSGKEKRWWWRSYTNWKGVGH